MTTETILDVTSEEKKTSVKTEVKNITEVENAPKSDSQNDVKQLTQPKSDVKSAEKNPCRNAKTIPHINRPAFFLTDCLPIYSSREKW